MSTVFLVFKQAPTLEFQGVFSSRDLALVACKDETYGIGPAVLDVELPDETVGWPGWEWPHQGDAK